MAFGKNVGTLEFPVTLGLDAAKKQLEAFTATAQKGLKPDSSGYKEITKMIESASKAADELRAKMSNSFKTSAGTKSYGKEYEKLLQTLGQIQQKFGSIGIKDLNLSDDQLKPLKEAQERLRALKTEMKQMDAGKIGSGLVDAGADFEKIRNIAKMLKTDISNLTFDQFGEKLESEINKVEPAALKLQGEFNKIQDSINGLSGDGLTAIIESLNDISGKGVTQKIIDPKEIQAANKSLDELSAKLNLQDTVIPHLTAKNSNDVEKFIQDQTKNIQASYDEQIAAINAEKAKVEQALQNINTAKIKGNGVDSTGRKKGISPTQITDLINSKEVQDALNVINFDQTSDTYVKANIREKFRIIQEALKDGVEDLTSKNDSFLQMRQNFEQQLRDVFDGMGEVTVSSSKDFIDKVNAILKQNGKISLKDLGLDKNSFDGQKVKDAYQVIINAIDEFVNKQKEAQKALKTTGGLDETTKKLENLKAAREALNQVQSSANSRKLATTEEIDTQVEKVNNLIEALQEASGMKVQLIDPETLKQGSNAISNILEKVTSLEGKQKSLSNIQMAINRWMGFWQVLNLVKRAISDMKQHIQELDTVMTKIAVVTNMSQDDLWGQISQYSELARQYGVAIKGVYEVSQLYYQQGLQKGDVMTLTQETLKMARIAGIDYSTATDYMTTAIRGFKLEMTEAAHVTDVFSNLAANTASSTEELAVAISKTAASAASVGASFEATSAMMATMIATTRESATNIGTALKSIISRYGEMKENLTGTDAEGEEYSLNKVDKALQTIGVSIHDAAGQFRDFDDVILELASAWDSIDKNTQRYIATVMAGNRQQSRFLALVSNVEEYKRALELANDSEGTGDIQTLKTLDSIDAKIEKMKVTIQEFYTSSGIQDLYKTILDTITNVINAANSLPKLFGKFPITALAVGMQIVNVVKNVLKLLINSIVAGIEEVKGKNTNLFEGLVAKFGQAGTEAGNKFREKAEAAMNQTGSGIGSAVKSLVMRYFSSALQLAGSGLVLSGMNQYGSSKTADQDRAAGRTTLAGAGIGVLGGIAGGAASGAAMGSAAGLHGMLIGGALGGISSLISNLGSIISGAQMLGVTLAREIELSTKALEEARDKQTRAKGEEKALQSAVDKYNELAKASYESAEAMAEFKDYQNQLADSYPYLVKEIDAAGNSIINLTELEAALASARVDSAEATLQATKREEENKKKQQEAYANAAAAAGGLTSNLDIETTYNLATTYLKNKQLATTGDKYWDIFRASEDFHGRTADINKLTAKYGYGFDYSSLLMANADEYLDFQNQRNLWNKNSINHRVDLKQRAEQILNDIKTQLPDISLGQLTQNENIQEASDITKLSDDKIIEALKKLQTNAQQQVDNIAEQLNTIDDTINTNALNLQIETYLKDNSKSNLKDYTSFVSSMITRQYGKVDWANTTKDEKTGTSNADELQTNLKNWERWLALYKEDADWLSKEFDFSKIKNVDSLKSTLAEHNISETETKLYDGKKIVDQYVQQYTDYIRDVHDDYVNTIQNVFGLERYSEAALHPFAKFFASIGTEGDTNTERVAAEFIPLLKKQLVEYKKVKDSGYELAAESYLDGLNQLYTGIGNITGENADEIQSSIYSILSATDLQDADSLQSALDSLADIEGVPKEITDALKQLYSNINVNVSAQAIQLSEKTSELAESVGKAFDNLGKGMDFDDAIKIAEEIYNKLTKEQKAQLKLTDLYKFDEELGQWIITEDAIQAELTNLTSEYNDEVKKISTKADLQKKLLESLLSTSDTQAALSQFLDENAISEEDAEAYKIMVESWTKGQENEQDLTALYNDMLQSIEDVKSNSLAAAKDLLKNSAISYLAKFDWTSITSGSANEASMKNQLTVLLTSAGVDPAFVTGKVNKIYKAALEGNVEALNKELGTVGLQLSNKTEQDIIQENVEKYKKAIDEVTNQPVESWSEGTKQLVAQLKADKTITSSDTNAIALELYSGLHGLIDGVKYTLEDYNNDIAALTTKILGLGKDKATVDLLKDGFKLEDFATYLNTYFEGFSLDNFFKDGKAIGEFEGLFELDENGVMQIVAGKEAEVLEAFQNALSIGIKEDSNLWKQLIWDSVDQDISKRAASSQEKKAASQLKALSTASIGEEVNISALDENLKLALGLSGDTYTVVYESERNNILAKINQALIDVQTDPTLKATLQQLKADIMTKTPSRSAAIQGVIGEKVTIDAAKTLSKAFSLDGSDAYYHTLMESLGYYWDSMAQQYIAGADSIEKIQVVISNLPDVDAEGHSNLEVKNNLQALLNQLETLQQNKPMEAIRTVLENYTNVSEQMISDFNTQWAEEDLDLNDYLEVDTITGRKELNIANLTEDLKEADVDINEWFSTEVAAIADTYIQSIEQATSLVAQGTTSTADMAAFTQTYNKVFETSKVTTDLFSYNEVLQAWTLDPAVLQEYAEAQAAQLVAIGSLAEQEVSTWVEEKTSKQLAQNINISDYLNATDKSITGDAFKLLTEQMRQYYEALGKSGEEANKLIATSISKLNKGGLSAVGTVKVWAARAGRKATNEEIEEAFNSAINEINNALDELSDITVGQLTTGKLREILTKTGNVDSDGIVRSTGDLVEAYAAIYAEMKKTNGKTAAGLNEAYAKLLTANDQRQIDALELMENASGMTYEALGEILAQYGNSFSRSLENVMNNPEQFGIEQIGFGKIRIDDFNKFASKLGFGDLLTELTDYETPLGLKNPELLKAYNEWVDSQVEFKNRNATLIQEAADELKQLTEAKPGQALNVSYLQQTMGASLQNVVDSYGLTLTNGLLQLNSDTDIPALISSISQAAAEAGALIPEQLAEVADAVADALSEIASLITNGIAGSLNNVQAEKLTQWGNAHGVTNLEFTNTADGLKLATDQALLLSNAIAQIDAMQGDVTFKALMDNLIKTDDRFKSVSATTAHIKTLEQEIARLQREEVQFAKAKEQYQKGSMSGGKPTIEVFDQLNGNVDMYNRPWIENADGSHSTIYSTAYDNYKLKNQEVHIMMTPIPHWAKVEADVLNQDELDTYLNALMEQNPIDLNALLELDAEGVDIEVNGVMKHISNMILDIKDATKTTTAEMRAEEDALHEWSEAWESTRRGIEAPDNSKRIASMQEELSLAEEIHKLRSATSEDDSFNFMDQKIPAGQNNPLNYWKNWAEAMSAIQDSSKSGTMDYTVFYNMVTELGNLAKTTNKGIDFGGQVLQNATDAANLIEQAAGALKSVDGKGMEVDLGKIGINFESGTSSMAEGVDEGIHNLAQSQIDMLDGMISLLETIVAMEQLSDLDIEGNGIDIGDIIKISYTPGEYHYDYTQVYDQWRKDMLDRFNKYLKSKGTDHQEEVDLGRALEGIKFTTGDTSKTFGDILKMSASDLNNMSEDFKKAYTSFLDGMVKASLSGNYDLDNVYDSIKDVLESAGINDLTIELENTTLTFSGGQITTINWNDAGSKAALDLIEPKIKEHTETAKNRLKEIVAKYNTNQTLTLKDLELALVQKQNSHITVKNGKTTITWEDKDGKPHTFTDRESADYKRALAAARLEDFGANFDYDPGESSTETTITGTITVGEKKNVKVVSDGETLTVISPVTGKTYNSVAEMQRGDFEFLQSQGAFKGQTFEEYLWTVYRIRSTTTTQVVGKDGKPLDISNDREIRQQIREKLAQGGEDLKKQIHADNEGGYELTLDNGIKIKFTEEDITTDGQIDPQKVQAAISKMLGLDQGLEETITNGIVGAIPKIKEGLTELNETEPTGLASWATAIETIGTSAETAMQKVEALIAKLKELSGQNTGDNTGTPPTGGTPTGGTPTGRTPTGGTTPTATTPETVELPDFSGVFSTITSGINSIAEAAAAISDEKIKNLGTAADSISDLKIRNLATAAANIDPQKAWSARNAINSIKVTSKAATLSVTARVNAAAKGTIGAFAKGNMALAGGTQTLMGELGPEMVVSNGRYFLVGQNGAEFVDLDKDAIVFNHLQTKRLLDQGGIGTRGVPVTNERNAVSFAKGNVSGPAMVNPDGAGSPSIRSISITNAKWVGTGSPILKWDVMSLGGGAAAKGLGPAMASASAALATLKQLRSMWQSLLGASIKDLAGGGAGGGGGGGGSKPNETFLKMLERWYNYLQDIDKLEKQITNEEAKRNRIASSLTRKNGDQYYKSQKASLEALERQAKVYKDLANEQETYFKKRIAELNNQTVFSSLYTFDDDGQIKYQKLKDGKEFKLFNYTKQEEKDGKIQLSGKKDKKNKHITNAFEFFNELWGRDSKTGKANYTVAEQFKILEENKLLDTFKDKKGKFYDSEGKEIDTSTEAGMQQVVQAFSDKIDADRDEAQSLYDSFHEYQDKFEKVETERNEILKEFQDNQIALENKVLDVVEEKYQKEIDDKQDERDALEKTNEKFINGLTNALNKERQMYETQQSESDLEKKRRRLAVLQRTGGSASEISSLQSEIGDTERDLYFEKQQEQIDLIQEASDKQLEKMDQEIEIMQEQLDYAKEHGLLWNEVATIMDGSAQEISEFIMSGSDWWNKSPVATAQDLEDTIFSAEQWVAYREDGQKNGEYYAENLDGLNEHVSSIDAKITSQSEDEEAGVVPTGTEEQPVKQDKKAKYRVTYTDENGKTKKKYFDKNKQGKKEAKKFQKETDGTLTTTRWFVFVHKAEDAEGTPAKQLGPYTKKEAEAKAEKLNKSKKYKKDATVAKKRPEGYSTGGLVTETGVAILHGSSTRPEAVLNAHQTEILRNDILGNKSTSLINLLREFQATAAKTANSNTYSTIDRSKSTSIGSISLNMDVKEIANDYDAKRAGEKAMEEMLRIARKSTTASIRG